MTRPVLIVNTNPLLNLVHPGHYIPGTINRVRALEIHAEGKGVNVARVLARLGHPVMVTGFAGGHSGAWLRDIIRAEGIVDDFVATEAPVRMGFMASCGRESHPTTVLPNGFPVTAAECAALTQRVAAALPGVCLAIISGSVPDPVAEFLYADLLRLCHAAGVGCWLDTHGPALNRALSGACPPDLAKPNLDEYRQGGDWTRVPELHVTDGANPVEARIPGQGVWRIAPPRVRQVNPVGCGDCYLAGLAHGWLEGWPLARRLVFASAAGAANALRQDVAMIDLADIQPLLGGVALERLAAPVSGRPG